MSKSTYRLLDLLILTTISAVIEFVNILAFKHFPFEGFSASFIIVMGLIAIYRWGIIGIIVPVVSGFVSVISTGVYSDVSFILSETAGFALMGVACIWFRRNDKREMSQNPGKLFLYFVTGFIAAEVGRSLCYIGSINIMHALYTFFVLDLFNLALNLLVFFIATRRKNLVYDMEDYFEDLQEAVKKPKSATMREAQQDYLALESLAESNQVSECALLDGGMLTDDDLILLQKNYNRFTGTPGKFDKENADRKRINKKEKTHD